MDPWALAAGLDDPQKYLVCYHCLRGKGKSLQICPRCQMVFFCSSQCNKLNMKLKTLHTCNLLFYDMPTGEPGRVSLKELADNVREKCMTRLNRARELKLEEEERKLLEMWRADTYGTKFLQIKPLLEKAVTKKKNKQMNWNLGLLKGLLERNFKKHPGEASLYSLENLLIKLHGKDWFRVLGQTKSEGTLRTKSWSTRRSTLGGSTLHSMIFQDPEPEETLKRKRCKWGLNSQTLLVVDLDYFLGVPKKYFNASQKVNFIKQILKRLIMNRNTKTTPTSTSYSFCSGKKKRAQWSENWKRFLQGTKISWKSSPRIFQISTFPNGCCHTPVAVAGSFSIGSATIMVCLRKATVSPNWTRTSTEKFQNCK